VDQKKRVEATTAEAFLSYYNQQEGTSYCVVKHGDAPDIRARDEQGEVLQFDIVQTKDRPDDIKAALGRSESRSLKALEQHVEEVRTGNADPRDRVSKLSGPRDREKPRESSGNVTESIKDRLRDKLKMRYGANTALVIRDTSGVDWDWDEIPVFQEIFESVLKELKEELGLAENPYDKGIWLVNRSRDRVFRLI
jgi:hypothetical protein